MPPVKLALLSDIHGNPTALNAVLKDIEEQGGVDEYWVLGDLAALGPEPVPVLERLNQLSNVRFCRGNTDRYLFAGDRPPPTLFQAQQDPELIPIFAEVAGTFAWSQGAVSQAGWLDWLRNLPFEIRRTLPDGTRLLGVHGAPQADDIPIHPQLSEQEIASLLAGCQADLICMGHTHIPLNIHVREWHVVNLGCVSNPPGADLRASYVYLTADTSGYHLRHCYVEYDYEVVIDMLNRIQHPGRAFIIRHFNKS